MGSRGTNWVWTPDWQAEDDRRAEIVYFRREMELEAGKVPASLRIRISADSHYKLYVNGTFVQDGPQKALDLKEWFADEAELAPYLTAGHNILAVEVLRYPEPNLSFGVPVSNDSLLRSPIPHLYVEQIGPCEGKEWAEENNLGAGSGGWRCLVNREIRVVDETSMPAPIHAQEIVAATEDAAGWKVAGYDDGAWPEVLVRDGMEIPKSDAPGNLVKRTVPYLRYKAKRFSGIKEIREFPRDVLREGKSGSIERAAGAFDSQEFEETETAFRHKWEEMLAGKGTVHIPARSRAVVEISAGAEQCGFLNYSFSGGKGAVITTLCSECYAYPPEEAVTTDGIPANPRKGDRTDSVKGRLYGHTSVYRMAGYGTLERPESYEPFWYRTFRFIQLTIETGEEALDLLDFSYRETGYPLEVQTEVATSDPSLAPIWEISLRTLERCMRDTYMDCPFYEQLQYAMDSREEILYTYAVSADDRLARQAIEAFRRSQRPDGMINASAPAQKSNVIPGFSIYYLLMVYDHMMYFGDRTLVRENWNAIDQLLGCFDRNLASNGMVGKMGGSLLDSRYWSFVDWTKEWNATMGVPSATNKGSGQLTMESLLYVYGLQKAAELSDFVGRKEVGAEYRDRAEAVLRAIRKYAMGSYMKAVVCADGKNAQEAAVCFDGEPVRDRSSVDGGYRKNAGICLVQDGPGIQDYSVHTQVFAILTGLVTPEEGREMLELTVGNPKFPQASVSYMFYLFRALEIAGWYEKTEELWELWRKMVREHMSTCVENGTDGRSDCHAWASLILYELPAVVLGVRPASPGFKSIRIAPAAGYLKSASGDVITPKGKVHVAWKKNADGALDIRAEVPEGIRRV